jgi:hypothetical protein
MFDRYNVIDPTDLSLARATGLNEPQPEERNIKSPLSRRHPHGYTGIVPAAGA